MTKRRILCILLANLFLGALGATGAFAGEVASTGPAAVPLSARTWSAASMPERVPGAAGDFVRTSAKLDAAFGGQGRSAAHAPDHGKDRFHVTAVRLWLYRDFLPNSVDSDVLGIEVNSAWGIGKLNFANISYIEVADYARAVPGRPAGNPVPERGSATGVTDFLTAFLVSPKKAHHGPHHFALGAAFQFPTASDGTLGSGKWSAGPAMEYEYHRGRFYAAFVALQLWSFAGDDDRKRVNMLMVKPMITYDLGHKWKAVYMPYGISVYWDKPNDDMVYLPLGAGIQREFCIGSQKLAASVQFFKYVLRPSKGSEYDLRFMLEFDF